MIQFLYWFRGLSNTTKMFGLIAAVAGAVAAIPPAWAVVEPFWYTSHGYFRERGVLVEQYKKLLKAHETDHQTLVETRIAQNEDRRTRLLSRVKERELELESDQAKATPQYKAVLQESIDRASAELKTLDEQDKSLFNEKAAGQR